MTLFIIGVIIIIFVFGFLALQEGFPPFLIIPLLFFVLMFPLFSDAKSRNHYFDPEIKPIEVQKIILKDVGAFLLYKIEGEEEEKAENVLYRISDKESHLSVKKPKTSVWWFINFAIERETVYLSKEDLKKYL